METANNPDTDNRPQPRRKPLASAFILYLFLLSSLLLFVYDLSQTDGGLITAAYQGMGWESDSGASVLGFMLLYLVAGVVLGKKALNRLIQWHHLATLTDIVRAKLHIIIFWVVYYPVLFIKLAFGKL